MSILFKYDKTKLDNITRFFNQKNEVRIGILSNQWSETAEGHEDNFGPVELGAVHEFGSEKRNIPKRSFLRSTMENRKDDFVTEIYQNRTKMVDSIANGDGKSFLDKVGATWKAYVFETFDRQGPGWAALSMRTMAGRRAEWTGGWTRISGSKKQEKEMKKSSKILWVTGALMRSVNYMVKRR
jgi:hypothetical protein